MRFTRVLLLTKSFRDEFFEARKPITEKKTISDFLVWLYKERDFSLTNSIKNFNEKTRLEAIYRANRFFDNDYYKLGPELHAATYALKLGGRCRLYGSPKWLSLGKNKLGEILPEKRVDNFYVEGLDLSKTVIQMDGISNFENCSNVKTLILQDCVFNDDWLLNRISHTFSETLEYLDISNCSNVTDNGILTLGYLKNLKKLKLNNLTSVKNKEFISILLEDNSKMLAIEGADHLSEEAFKHVENMLREEELNLKNIIESKK